MVKDGSGWQPLRCRDQDCTALTRTGRGAVREHTGGRIILASDLVTLSPHEMARLLLYLPTREDLTQQLQDMIKEESEDLSQEVHTLVDRVTTYENVNSELERRVSTNTGAAYDRTRQQGLFYFTDA